MTPFRLYGIPRQSIIKLAMPRGRKVKINMKQFIAKHGLSEQKPAHLPSRPEEEQWDEETKSQKSQKDPPESKSQETERECRKEDAPAPEQLQRREEEQRKPQNGKKQTSIKVLIKQVSSSISEQRKRSSFPASALAEIEKAAPQVRAMQQFQRLHQHYFKLFDVFRKGTHPEIEHVLTRLSEKMIAALHELKQQRVAEASTLKGERKDRYSGNILRHYSMELKLKQDEIKRKRNFREFARGKFGPQVKQIQDFITVNSRLVTESILRERFQLVIDQAATANNQVVSRKEREYRENMRSLFGEWRKIKKEKMMLDKIERAERIQRNERLRANLAGRFANFMGVLINPFNIYDELR